jgi:hypothetical protein
VTEPWVNFTNAAESLDVAIFLRPDRKERLHIYQRPCGTFGRRNFVWIEDEHYAGWTVGTDWSHVYDSAGTAMREAQAAYPWLAGLFPRNP